VSADGRSYFTYSRFKRANQFELIHRDLTNHRELARFQVADNTIVSGNGKCVVFQKSGERTIRLRDIFANREFTLLESPSWPMGRKGFSPDGRVLAWCDPDQIQLWDSETGKPVGSLPQANANAIAFSADGRYFAAVATRTGAAALSVTVMFVGDRVSGLRRLIDGVNSALDGTAASPDGSPPPHGVLWPE
jgi:WD40 repeat protein